MNERPMYTLILRWREKQRAYIGQVQELVGVEGTGSSYQEALASTLEAMRWWSERSGEGSSSPFSQMLMREPEETEQRSHHRQAEHSPAQIDLHRALLPATSNARR